MVKTVFRYRAGLVLFGVVLAFLLLEAGMRLAGFLLLRMQEHKNERVLFAQGAYRVMCLGESTTANQYPRFLEEALNQLTSGGRFRVIDKGRAGTNTAAILAELESDLDRYRPQVVVVMMGINDDSHNMPVPFVIGPGTSSGWGSWRVVKLFRLIALHITAKLEAGGLVRSAVREAPAPPADGGRADHAKPRLNETRPDEGPLMRTIAGLQQNSRFAEADRLLRDLVRKNPRNAQAFARLGWGCLPLQKVPQAVNCFRKSIKLDPRDPWAVRGLGTAYEMLHQYAKAGSAFRKLQAMDPRNDWPYIELAHLYFLEQRFGDAEVLLKDALGRADRKDRLYGALSAVKRMTRKATVSPSPFTVGHYYYLSWTVRNYKALYRILKQRGIALVCVQYPMRPLAPLADIFDKQERVVFVDNEKLFRSAVGQDRYWEYFRDSFGGDFGHCTEKGNRLLAGNIAKVILKDVLGLKQAAEPPGIK